MHQGSNPSDFPFFQNQECQPCDRGLGLSTQRPKTRELTSVPLGAWPVITDQYMKINRGPIWGSLETLHRGLLRQESDLLVKDSLGKTNGLEITNSKGTRVERIVLP